MTSSLFATPETGRALGEARAAVVLVGGYDGSGNYGDIALLEAALELVERLAPGLLALPLLERGFREDHLALAGAEGWATHAAFFDPGGRIEDDLVPLAAPADLAFGAIYLYGGGYLNGFWGERKLTMLSAAAALFAAGGIARPCRVASGLQVEAAWIEALGEEEAAVLRGFDYLGVRDGTSGDALAKLGLASPPRPTADDAVAVLGQLAPAEGEARADGGRLLVNLHFAEHDWVSDSSDDLLGLHAGLVAELARLTGRAAVAQPLIAYMDGRVDERAAAERLGAACSALGVELAEPLVLRPAELPQAAPRLAAADLTVSCSYHVALTSLMLGVPAILCGDSPYYAQKAAGLGEDFELPPTFTVTASTDPVAAAGEIAAALDGDGLRRQIAAGAERLRRYRTTTEADLLGRLAGGAISALDRRAAELTGRLRQRSTEPAELRKRLAALQSELEEQRRHGDESPLEAELRVQEAEVHAAEAHAALANALNSRSWRLGAPLRRAGALLRRR